MKTSNSSFLLFIPLSSSLRLSSRSPIQARRRSYKLADQARRRSSSHPRRRTLVCLISSCPLLFFFASSSSSFFCVCPNQVIGSMGDWQSSPIKFSESSFQSFNVFPAPHISLFKPLFLSLVSLTLSFLSTGS